jgi:hypothetical protein
MKCASCGQDIDPERLEVLPDTRTCVMCSKQPRNVVFMEYGHKNRWLHPDSKWK